MDCLLLNADYRPRRVINWKDAVSLVLRDAVYVEQEHEDWVVSSPSVSVVVPSVVVLKRYINRYKKVRFNRTNVYIRDGFTCQYCNRSAGENNMTVSDLTFDHVKPRSKGGTTKWTNIVTACRACNRRKDDMTLDQAGMHLQKMPTKPRQLSDVEFRLRKRHDIPKSWEPYLEWTRKAS